MQSGRQLWLAFVVVLAVMLAGSALVAASARATGTSSDNRPPRSVLIKGKNVLQTGRVRSYSWNYHVPGEGWQRAERRVDEYAFPRGAPLLEAGKKLCVRIHKSQRPQYFSVMAYRGFDRHGVPLGGGQLLGITLEPVRHGGKTVAWDAFFRVKQPDRHYYLQTSGSWKRMPHARSGYGKATTNFHVRTR